MMAELQSAAELQIHLHPQSLRRAFSPPSSRLDRLAGLIAATLSSPCHPVRHDWLVYSRLIVLKFAIAPTKSGRRGRRTRRSSGREGGQGATSLRCRISPIDTRSLSCRRALKSERGWWAVMHVQLETLERLAQRRDELASRARPAGWLLSATPRLLMPARWSSSGKITHSVTSCEREQVCGALQRTAGAVERGGCGLGPRQCRRMRHQSRSTNLPPADNCLRTRTWSSRATGSPTR